MTTARLKQIVTGDLAWQPGQEVWDTYPIWAK